MISVNLVLQKTILGEQLHAYISALFPRLSQPFHIFADDIGFQIDVVTDLQGSKRR